MVGFRSLAMCCLLVVAATATGQAAAPVLIVAGTDPAGDSHNYIAPGADVGSQISPARTDIVGLHLGEDAETLTVRLDIGVGPSGTGGYMYRVNMKAGATTYMACWNIQYTGNVAQASQQDTLGCTRFTGVTRVGPTTTTNGVVVGSDDIGSFVQWSVGRSAIGGAGIADLTEVFADTWFRGASNCCVGSTTQSAYLWNQADRGPDTDFFAIDLSQLGPDVGAVDLTLVAVANSTTLVAGAAAEFAIHVGGGNATLPENTTVVLDATGLPPGWTVAWTEASSGTDLGGNGTGNGTSNGTADPAQDASAPPDVSMGAGNGTTNVTLVLGGDKQNATMVLAVMAPAGVPNGTYNFTVEAFVGGMTNASTLATLSVTVINVEDASLHRGQDETRGTDAGKGIPALAIPVVLLATLAALTLARRREL